MKNSKTTETRRHGVKFSPCLRASVVFFTFLAPLFLSAQEITQSLNSSWQFSESGKNDWLPATVPGTVHTDLLANKKIPDPYIGNNESKVQWVETKTWEYKSTFNASDDLWKCKHKELIFDGLDTYADVYLNEKLILTSEDMFLPATIDVTTSLKKENNSLRIVFHPASELIAKNKAASTIKNLPGGDRVFIRKAQYQFGWDWGPRMVTCGIWKNVKLNGWNDFKINTNVSTLGVKNDTATIRFRFKYFGSELPSLKFKISDNQTVYNSEIVHHDSNEFWVEIKVPHPRLWWCNGMGKQEVYNFTCSITQGKQTIIQKVRHGIRTITLEEPIKNTNQSFTFYLNGQPVFIKGANWIPSDNFTPRITSEKYYTLVKSAQESNINMLRVWGGGIYESDDFYNDCDSLGIMVWQDFMFANGMIPDFHDFNKIFVSELEQNIRRLDIHPCIAVWCGNNEIDEGWNNWGWQKEFGISSLDSITMIKNYNLFFDVKARVVVALNSVAPYLSTSPSTGWGHPEAYKSGDVHYWGVWWGNEPLSAYDNHVGRFVSEYGMQALPNESSFRQFDSDPNISLADSTIRTHQKSENGFAKLNAYMQDNYNVPTDFSDFKTASDFSDYIYVSQVLQRDAISRAIHDHRSAEPYCMGTLFWQFNDCWPVTSWSSIDYYGQAKLMNYALKDLYAPVLVSVIERNDSILLYVTNDDSIRHVGILGFQWMSMSDGTNARTSIARTTVYAGRSMMILGFPKEMLLKDLKAEQGVLNVVFSYEGDKSVNTKYYLVKTKNLALAKDPGIVTDVVAEPNKKNSYVITLRTVSLAKNIYLTLSDVNAKFSDNGFDMMAGETKDVTISTTLSLDELKKQLKIQTMNSFMQ